jgi:hypothetical protein
MAAAKRTGTTPAEGRRYNFKGNPPVATIVALSQENLVGRTATSMGEILASEWEQTRERAPPARGGLGAEAPTSRRRITRCRPFEEFAQAKRDQYARRSVR